MMAQPVVAAAVPPKGGAGFLAADEHVLIEAFSQNGYIIGPSDDRSALDRIRARVAGAAAEHLAIQQPIDSDRFLNTIADRISPGPLNDLRLAVIGRLTSDPSFREDYFACGRRTLEAIVGNELAMQRSVGFSIQLPHDDGSLLPLHSDCWSEDSPYEVVLWIPLVDCARTKSMYLAAPAVDRRWRARMNEFARAEDLFAAMEHEVTFLEIPYGNVLIFTHTLMHGNRVNREATARWSLNVRFKGLFTPYSDKKLGDFFEPITLRPATRIGLEYELPEGFHE
jgi:sporadic carbohydrate cluster 2OG-Fe(II) oxygenase